MKTPVIDYPELLQITGDREAAARLQDTLAASARQELQKRLAAPTESATDDLAAALDELHQEQRKYEKSSN